jgi:hypothetical protein
MRNSNRTRIGLVIATLLVAGSAWAGHGQPDLRQTQARKIDLVIALDTSSSMNGLIDSARSKLWDVVSLLGKARPQPIVRVGLISYGNTGYDRSVGWVRKDADLTTDLDAVYAKLFALRTSGGDEYVARALTAATDQMQWDQDPHTLKIVFVAGNEPANQDPLIPVESAVARARQKGLFVNTIYCGSASAGEAALWNQVASVGGGKYAAIDMNRTVAIATPMDAELSKLSIELNKTYVAYGRAGDEKRRVQAEQDKNAASMGGVAAASRAAAKASPVYRNDTWDLVDAKEAGKPLGGLAADELPAELRNLSAKEREDYVARKAKERAAIQARIAQVNAERERYITAERKKASAAAPTFDDAVTSSIKTEAQSAGFSF